MESEPEIRDGGHNLIKCPGCKRELVDIWIVSPDATMNTKIRALCSCGDKSFYTNVKGRFYAAPTDQSDLVDIITVSDDIDTLEILITTRAK